MRSLRNAFLVLGLGLVVAPSCFLGGGDKGDDGSGGGGGPSGTGGRTTCSAGLEGCACYGNGTCDPGLTCASNLCVRIGGSGGSTLPGGSGGSTTPGGSGGSTPPGGSGGSTLPGGSGGSTPPGGSGGSAPPGCNCPSGQECTTDTMRCVNPNIIEDFADCDTSLTRVRGRTGGWYGAADVGINLSFSVSVPPSGFSDRRCGAWVTGGPTGNGSATWAVMGVGFSQSSAPYDLRGYTGITVDLEAESVDFTLKTTNGGYFGYRLPRTSGSQAFQVSFSQLQPRSDSATQILDLGAVTDIQFTPINAMVGFGFVIHGLTLIR